MSFDIFTHYIHRFSIDFYGRNNLFKYQVSFSSTWASLFVCRPSWSPIIAYTNVVILGTWLNDIILFLCLFDEEKSSLKLFFCILQKGNTMINPAGNYMFEVNDKNTRKRCQICSKLKLVSAIFYQIFISHQMIALQKLRRMLFISSKKLFSFSRYSSFCISIFPSFSPCQPLF